ncbi:clusterin-like protein 1 [Hoplias malabaricus]|uniref:clusterin-like protein 1 n=1 Tax=Hoplias malabaricus TaxID=27720 RepID=UPI003462298B
MLFPWSTTNKDDSTVIKTSTGCVLGVGVLNSPWCVPALRQFGLWTRNNPAFFHPPQHSLEERMITMMVVMTMQLCLSLLLSCLTVTQGAPQPQRRLDESQLKMLSAEGEQYVDEELKRALLGVKQMKETMDKTEEKHQQLIKTLKQSHDKKRGAEQLAQEANQELQNAEQQCQDRLRPVWEKCRRCLQARCGSFYTSTCRRSSSSFSLQVEEFVRRMASKLDEGQDQIFSQSPDNRLDTQNQTQTPVDQHTPENQNKEQLLEASTPAGIDKDLVWVKNTFSRIKAKVSSLYSSCSALVSEMRLELGSAFLSTFTEDVQPESLPSENLKTGGFHLSGAFDSFMEMGRSVLHEVRSSLTQVFEGTEGEGDSRRASGWLPGWMSPPGGALCRRLRSRVAECRQPLRECDNCHQALLTECPEVPEHYSELSEISLLLNVSRGQYEEVLQVLRTHTEHTLHWAENMTRQHGWVTHISNGSAPPHVFSLVQLVPGNLDLVGGARTDTVVEVTVLDSPALSISVPADLEISEPAFIQYIAKEALVTYQNTLANTLHTCHGGLTHATPQDD